MARVHILLDVTTVTEPTETAGTAIFCQHIKDEAGAVQYKISNGTCDEVELQGRLTEGLPWVEIATSGSLNASGTSEVLQTGVAVMPQMRAVMKNGASATVKVAFME